MAARIEYPEEYALLKHQFGVVDHFDWFITAHRWTALAADSTATVSVGDAAGGILSIFTDTTNENEAGIFTSHEIFKLAANKPLRCGARIQFTELGGNGANVAVGLGDAPGANLLLDAGAGVSTSFNSCFFIYKTDGSTVWKIHSENGTDAEDFTSTVTAGGASYVDLEMHTLAIAGSMAEYEVVWTINGGFFYDSGGRIVKHHISYASATEMKFGIYAKTGTSTEALTVLADWAYCLQAL